MKIATFNINNVNSHLSNLLDWLKASKPVRAASSAMLEELGYSVREAASADDALKWLREDNNVDVLFTDVIMSTGMSGIDLAHAVKAKWPALPVLLTSGYTAQCVIPSAMNGEMRLPHKLYTIQELAEVMQQTIAGDA